MTSYLLLRNNKESGPHSFEQLLGFNLKPYDLVWVNGKSAAWRYPSEIEELKAYAPGEVEQPFDRFFKKPTETNLPLFPENGQNQQVLYTEPPVVLTTPVRQEQATPPIPEIPTPVPQVVEEVRYVAPEIVSTQQQYVPKKSVYVTMPGQRQAPAPVEEYKAEIQKPVPVTESPKVNQGAPRINEPQYLSQPSTPVNEKTSTPVNLAPVNEIRYMPTEASPVNESRNTPAEKVPVNDTRYLPKEPVREPVYNQRETTAANETRYMPRDTSPVKEAGYAPAAAGNESRYMPRETGSINDRYMPGNSEGVSPTVSITENPVTAQIKYSQPLDEIKEMYVKTLQSRKDKMARQAFFKVNLKRVAVIAGLIGVGGLAGYIIKSGAAKKQDIVAAQQLPATNNPAVNSALLPIPEANETTLPEERNQTARIESKLVDEAINRAFKKPEQSISSYDQPDNFKEKPTGKSVARNSSAATEKVAYSPVETNNQTGERSRTVRTEESLPQEKTIINAEETRPVRKTTKSVLGSQVFVTTNDYKRVAFGGIRNLELTVTNNSKYELDNVLVELDYLKPSEETLHTQSIRFNGIAPNEAATIRIPDTNRGIKVKYRIISIGSKQLNADLANN